MPGLKARPTYVLRHALTVCAIVMASMTMGAAQQGTAEISGTVITTSVPPAPLARVLVTISGQSLKASRTVITDEQGRFVFRDLPGGSFTIVAARPPYVKTTFGAKRPGRPGTPINLAAGQRVTGVTIPLAAGAAITGVIRHAGGEPAVGVKVEATPLILDARAAPLGAQVVTDDRGVYRIFGLPPGKYVVNAAVTERASTVLTQFSDAEMDALLARLQRRTAGLPATSGGAIAVGGLGTAPVRPDPNRRPATYGYAPIYYPGSADPDLAATVALGEGEERAGVDLALQLVRTVAVEGRVSIASGTLPPGTQVTLTRQGLRESASATNMLISAASTRQPDAAGDFSFVGILPGKYRIVARATAPPARASDGVYWALADVTTGDADVSGLALMLQAGLRLSGRLAFESRTQTPPRDLTTIRLRLTDANGTSTFVPPSGTGRADGTFEITGILPGTYGMTSLLVDGGWWLRSVVVDGRDVLDFPLDIGPAGDVNGAVATFTDQRTELSGTLQSAANVPAPDYFVVVFARDRTFWRPASRRVQFTRPGTDGRFGFRDLPAGDYLMAALTDMEPSDLIDQSFLETLIPLAVPVHLNDGEKRTQDLKLIR